MCIPRRGSTNRTTGALDFFLSVCAKLNMSIRHLYFLAVFVASILFGAPVAQCTQFFQAAQDIPLMHGLIEDMQGTLTYDSPQGRIIESVSILDGVNKENVRTYYNENLPAFGWQFSAPNEFVRHNEMLRLDFISEDDREYFLIFIQPR